MGPFLTLRHASTELLRKDFEANLRKGRAFVPAAPGVNERDFCQLRIEPPHAGKPWCTEAEVVWLDPAGSGIGLSFVAFDAIARDALRSFIATAAPVAPASAHAPGSGPPVPPATLNLHDRIRQLDVAGRDALARQGNFPERAALERCYGGSVWEGLLHNPDLTPREVVQIARNTNLAVPLVTLIVANRAWTADVAVSQALLGNPRLSVAHLDRVLRSLPQAELTRIGEQPNLRLQVRQAAKRLMRR
jgi:hypothetical protein